MNIIIKKADLEDIREIAKIYAEEFSKPPYNESWTEDKAIFKITKFFSFCDIWKASIDNKIAGFIIINPNYWCPGEIVFGEEIAISQQYQMKGIGTQLVTKILEEYKSKGYKRFMGIININSKSLNLFKKFDLEKDKENIVIGVDLK